MLKSLILLLPLISSVNVFSKTKVIYGEDDRVDYYNVMDLLKTDLSSSVATLVPRSALQEVEGGYLVKSIQKLKDIEIQQNRYLCEDEKFANQQVLGICSGFMVDSNKIATAGHCYPPTQKEYFCKNYVWVFDFKLEDINEYKMTMFTNDQVFDCKKVITSIYNTKQDYSLIELSDSIPNREPLILDDSSLSSGLDIFVIGYPYGLPLKITSNANIFELSQEYFSTNLDTFQGNSGSPVFDETSGNVIGILVRGKDDYYEDKAQKCIRVNKCSEDRVSCISNRLKIDGEHVNKIGRLSKLLKSLKN